jgi:hypothetical protein
MIAIKTPKYQVTKIFLNLLIAVDAFYNCTPEKYIYNKYIFTTNKLFSRRRWINSTALIFVPFLWKSANVSPVPKSSPAQDIDSDFRAISLTAIVSKILELARKCYL